MQIALILALLHTASANPDLAEGPYSTMHMLLERSVFKANVLRAEVRVSEETQKRLENLAAGQNFSEPVENQVAQTILKSDDAQIQLRFLRNIDLGKFLSGAKSNVECARKAGFISEKEHARVKDNLPHWFQSLEERGIQKGDQLTYRVTDNAVQVTFRAWDGRNLVDYSHEGKEPRVSVLASYFAPCSEFREPLVRSLFTETQFG